jgi:hypothetical protein
MLSEIGVEATLHRIADLETDAFSFQLLQVADQRSGRHHRRQGINEDGGSGDDLAGQFLFSDFRTGEKKEIVPPPSHSIEILPRSVSMEIDARRVPENRDRHRPAEVDLQPGPFPIARGLGEARAGDAAAAKNPPRFDPLRDRAGMGR